MCTTRKYLRRLTFILYIYINIYEGQALSYKKNLLNTLTILLNLNEMTFMSLSNYEKFYILAAYISFNYTDYFKMNQ